MGLLIPEKRQQIEELKAIIEDMEINIEYPSNIDVDQLIRNILKLLVDGCLNGTLYAHIYNDLENMYNVNDNGDVSNDPKFIKLIVAMTFKITSYFEYFFVCKNDYERRYIYLELIWTVFIIDEQLSEFIPDE